jgi:hypothetical protein
MSDADTANSTTARAPGAPPIDPTGRASVPPASPVGTRPVEGPSTHEGPDWTQQVTDLVVDTVDKVRSRTTGPILEVARGLVLALVAMVLVIPVMALLFIFLVRILDWAIPGDVWIVYCGLGIIFVLAGVLLWRLRTPRADRR